jgi:hypothetical protein
MGIKHLNRLLLSQCSDRSIRTVHLSDLAKKTVVIDTSIYLYKFLEKNALLENIYLMINVLQKYHILPVFIFDGKPPEEKRELLMKRRQDKDNAENKYNAIVASMAPSTELLVSNELDRLKRRFIRITPEHISLAQNLMDAFGVPYLYSHGESDQLCAFLVKHQFAYACASDDMDMFLHGCPRVLRYVNFIQHECTMYDFPVMLEELRMTAANFRDAIIMSGTDYNMHDYLFPLHITMEMYYGEEFQTAMKSNESLSFYEFMMAKKKNTIDMNQQDTQKDKMDRTRKLFDMNEYMVHGKQEIKEVIDRLPFQQENMDWTKIKEIMRMDGFLFA